MKTPPHQESMRHLAKWTKTAESLYFRGLPAQDAIDIAIEKYWAEHPA